MAKLNRDLRAYSDEGTYELRLGVSAGEAIALQGATVEAPPFLLEDYIGLGTWAGKPIYDQPRSLPRTARSPTPSSPRRPPSASTTTHATTSTGSPRITAIRR
jgi:hypothetical protein